MKEVKERLRLSYNGIQSLLQNDDDFPKPIKFGTHKGARMYWDELELEKYINICKQRRYQQE